MESIRKRQKLSVLMKKNSQSKIKTNSGEPSKIGKYLKLKKN